MGCARQVARAELHSGERCGRRVQHRHGPEIPLSRMFILFDAERPSDSPFIERVWRCHSEGGGPFLSVASSHWELVVTRLKGDTYVTLRGPETRAREIDCPPDGEWFA